MAFGHEHETNSVLPNKFIIVCTIFKKAPSFRWNIVIRSCIDGKSRLVVYLDASGDNTALSNLMSFVKAVSKYGVPYRTRSDKGKENVLIARFMIEQRGTGRASHICGRSVHNQRYQDLNESKFL